MEEILCTLEKEGFIAHYFKGNRDPDKAIISVGGASCDEKTSIAMSCFLREAGYNVLVLGFYMWKGLSKNLSSVPVDYAEKAVHWLKDVQGIQKIAMTGASTGGGYTLLCASLIPEITCVIPVVPYDYVMEGTTPSCKRLNRSVYTWHGEDYPFTPWKCMDKGRLDSVRMARKAGYGLRNSMRFSYDYAEKDPNPDSRIRVENMNADVLLLAVEHDDCWPSEVAVRRMVRILGECGYGHRVEYHIYEDAGHALVDGLDKMSKLTVVQMKLLVPAEGRNPEGCEAARKDSFRRILEFLEQWQ